MNEYCCDGGDDDDDSDDWILMDNLMFG